ncbi:MAG: iron chelate uptake ABC transporter family permease subunit, partial [Lachnospiraceae bacterium]|nr:iron chelate uptake ABC transporter family permease subunit [Lachnospiraceae bacterium]
MLKKLKEEVISFSSNNTHSDYFEVDLSESEKLKDKNTEKYLKEIKENDKKSMVAGAIVTILLIFTILISFNVGRYAVDIKNVVRILFKDIFHFEKTWEDVYETIVWNVRMPRIIAALLVGSSLSVAGATYQGLFKNPMVSPDILGASAGASVGACFMMLLNQNGMIIQLAAFAFGLFAVTLTYSLSKAISKSADMVLMLVLCGLIVSTL